MIAPANSVRGVLCCHLLSLPLPLAPLVLTELYCLYKGFDDCHRLTEQHPPLGALVPPLPLYLFFSLAALPVNKIPFLGCASLFL
jgi:hypothetical protein